MSFWNYISESLLFRWLFGMRNSNQKPVAHIVPIRVATRIGTMM